MGAPYLRNTFEDRATVLYIQQQQESIQPPDWLTDQRVLCSALHIVEKSR